MERKNVVVNDYKSHHTKKYIHITDTVGIERYVVMAPKYIINVEIIIVYLLLYNVMDVSYHILCKEEFVIH